MSSVYLDRKNLDKAISLLDEAAVISQKDNSKANEEIVRTELMYSKCFSYYRMEEYQQAEVIGEQILRFLDSGRHFSGMDPNGVQIARLRAMTIMALIKGKQGDKKTAGEYADEALRLLKKFPGVPDVRGRLSESLYHLGRYGDLRTIAEPIIGNKYPFGSSVGSLSVVQLSERQKKICKLIKENPFISTQQMSVVLSVVKRTAERDLSDMEKKGVLIREGNTSAGHWVLLLDV